MTSSGELSVKDVPVRKETNAYSLGLIGDFVINVYTDRAELSPDDLLSVTLAITGTGNLEHINVPTLELEGWTVYQPEVDVRLDRQRALLGV